jgi:UDP-N-acetylglucosamine enolpyruvyl transferase
MEKFVIEGGVPLSGTVVPAGNKNAALPLLACSLLTEEEVVLRNVPRIRDVEAMLALLADLGVQVHWREDNTVSLQAADVSTTDVAPQLAERIRASVLVGGPLLARFGTALLPPPGGDVIGRRRLDPHLDAFRALGATVDADRDIRLSAPAGGLEPVDFFMDEPSVMATENALMAAALIDGTTVIRNAASEPHVQDLARMLNKMGAAIEGIGSNVERDAGDYQSKIEDGPWPAFPADLTSIAVALATQSEGSVLIFEKMFENRLFFVDKLISMGAEITICDPHRAIVIGPRRLRAQRLSSPDIRAGMAMLIAALCAQGTSEIHNIREIDRGYERIDERLRDLGAQIERVAV